MAACGEEFTVVLSDKQFVWAFGLGNVGQMGGGNAESHSVPTRVASMDGKGAHLVSCGASQVRELGLRLGIGMGQGLAYP